MVAVRLLTPKYCTAPRSFSTSSMAIVTPTISAGRDSGSTTARKLRQPLAPIVRAAASTAPDCIRKKARQLTKT